MSPKGGARHQGSSRALQVVVFGSTAISAVGQTCTAAVETSSGVSLTSVFGFILFVMILAATFAMGFVVGRRSRGVAEAPEPEAEPQPAAQQEPQEEPVDAAPPPARPARIVPERGRLGPPPAPPVANPRDVLERERLAPPPPPPAQQFFVVARSRVVHTARCQAVLQARAPERRQLCNFCAHLPLGAGMG